MGTTSLDPATVNSAAQCLDAAADLVLDAANLRLQFDGASAGRSHAAAGGAVRTAVESVVADLRRWALTTREVASALRIAADYHATADAEAATVLR